MDHRSRHLPVTQRTLPQQPITSGDITVRQGGGGDDDDDDDDDEGDDDDGDDDESTTID